MLVFKITESDVKAFMAQLLRDDTFYLFDVRGVEIAAMTKFQISGALDKDYIEGEAEQEAGLYCPWRLLQPTVRELIKGKKRPKSIKLTLSLPAERTSALHQNASAFFLNISYEHDEILCTTGASEKHFSMDKAVNAAWDDYIKAFIEEKNVVISAWM